MCFACLNLQCANYVNYFYSSVATSYLYDEKCLLHNGHYYRIKHELRYSNILVDVLGSEAHVDNFIYLFQISPYY